MYGWTDPMDPDRAEPPTEESPHWDNGRPMPRSSYLFGDEPEEPTAGWHDGPHGGHRHGERPDGYAWTGERPHVPPTDPDRTGPGLDATVQRRAVGAPAGDGRHRSRRRVPRPFLVVGAAAAATLVVAVGIGAVLMPDEAPPATVTAEDVPVAPPLPGADLVPSASASATPSPRTVSPTPSPSRSVKPTPAPSRTTAPSRRTVERSKAPTARATTAAAPATGGTEQAQVVALVNAERAKAGCGAVSVDAKLTTAAQRHSDDQAANRKMSHTGSDGSNVGDRLDRVGYDWRGYGENVAWNQQTPAAVMSAWMNSSGHRANILNCAFTEIGVGVARSNGPYWTQVFGTPG
ncbi:CAP domain-containing protein [Micromonospora sp. NPDC050187]|uniref:CAP domain-containing protein n=1 Tax=Micromonospora sp. NPDC050187 TaxID=3364277 RepID=UPI00378F1571